MKTAMASELDLGQLIKRICLKWRTFLISILIGVVAFSLLGFVLSVKEHHDANAVREALIAIGDTVNAETIVVPAIMWIDKVFVLLGVLVGAIITIVRVGIPYIMSPNLRVAEDMVNCFGLAVLGVIQNREGLSVKGKLDSWLIQKLYPQPDLSRDTIVQIACTDISLMLRKSGIKSVYFTGCSSSERVSNLYNDVYKNLREQNIDVHYDALALHSPHSVERFLQSEAIVLLEEVGGSRYEDVAKEVEYCNRYSIPIIGCLLIDNISK